MKYPVLVHKDENSAFGVTIPDIPGCFTAGDTLAEALANVQEVVGFYFSETDIEVPPEPSNIQEIEKDQPDGSWFLVDIDFSFFKPKSWKGFFEQGPCEDFPSIEEIRAGQGEDALRESLDELLEQGGDYTLDDEDKAWLQDKPVGREKLSPFDVPDEYAEELFEKSNLFIKIENYVFEQGIETAAERLGIMESVAQDLAKGLIDNFSIEDLEKIADKLPEKGITDL